MRLSAASLHSAQALYLRNRRLVTDIGDVLERRKFLTIRKEFYDALWRDAAREIGAQARSRQDGYTQVTRSGLTTFMFQSDMMLDSSIMVRMMLSKVLTYEFLSSKGIRTPKLRHFDLSTLDRADAFMRAHGGPVVVKPGEGTGGGRGVTTGISTSSGLKSASKHAAAFHSRLLVEEHLTGSSYRLLFLDGKFVDAVRRDPPMLVGDGKSTIRNLANAENQRRRTRRPISALTALIIDRESRNTLAARGKSPSWVPEAGEAVPVKIAVNENGASENHIVRGQVHEEIVDTAGRVVRELGIRFAGLDVTADDISAPLKDSGAIFNEINVNPGLHYN